MGAHHFNSNAQRFNTTQVLVNRDMWYRRIKGRGYRHPAWNYYWQHLTHKANTS